MMVRERKRERERERVYHLHHVNRIGEVPTDLFKEGLKTVLVFGVSLKATMLDIS